MFVWVNCKWRRLQVANSGSTDIIVKIEAFFMPPKNCDTMKPDCYPACSCQTNESCLKAVIFDDLSTNTKHGNKLMSSCHQAVTKKSTNCQKFLNYHQEKLFFRTVSAVVFTLDPDLIRLTDTAIPSLYIPDHGSLFLTPINHSHSFKNLILHL